MADFSYDSIKETVSEGFSKAADAVSGIASETLDTVKGAANSLVSTLLSEVKQPSAEGLSHYLMADFFEVQEEIGRDINGSPEVIAHVKPLTPIVRAFVIEADFSVDLNWQSPFESAGPETKAPALTSMLQSGFLESVIGSASNLVDWGKSRTQENGTQSGSIEQTLRSFAGRTGISKLNSRQTFNGMAPYKIQMTLLFRAWMDAGKEVEVLFDQMMSWALPQYLANDATIVAVADNFKNDKTLAESLLPSKVPQMIGMRYKGRTFMPLVIESIGQPLSSPINAQGQFVQLQIPITLCSIAAIDRSDWKRMET